jgi:hypothetical protein
LRRLTREEALERCRPHVPVGSDGLLHPLADESGWMSWMFEFEGPEPVTEPNSIIIYVNRFTGGLSFEPTE